MRGIVSAGLVLACVACSPTGNTPTPGDTGPTAPGCPRFREVSDGLPAEGEWKTLPSIGDVNGDGLGDIVALPRKGTGPRVFLSDGTGGWTDRSEDLQYPSEISCGIGTRLTDLNADGLLDLLVADHCQGVFVFLGDGKGGWTPASEGIPRNMQGFNDADAGDLDGDGIPDIVALSAFTAGFLVLRGQPDGTWEVWPDTGLPSSGLGFTVRLVDLNRDGLLDVITSYGSVTTERRVTPGPSAKVWIHGPPGLFRPATGTPDKGRFFDVGAWRPEGRAVANVILALSGARGGLYQLESDDGVDWTDLGRFDNAGFPEEGAGFVGLAVADMNADGCEDLVVNEGSSGKPWLVVGDCKGGWRFCPSETMSTDKPLPTWGVATGDLNGDGRLDVVAAFGIGPTGGLKAWFQTGGR